MTKSSQIKGLNYIPLLESTYPEMQRKTSLCQRGTRAPGPWWAGGAKATRQSGACVPGPRWLGGSSYAPERRMGPQPLVGRLGSGRVLELRTYPRHPVGGAPAARQSGARAPGPQIPFFEFTYPEMQRKHIPRVNEYQS